MVLDINDIAAYIQNELLAEGTVVKHEDIVKVLDLETEYLVLLGVAEVQDE